MESILKGERGPSPGSSSEEMIDVLARNNMQKENERILEQEKQLRELQEKEDKDELQQRQEQFDSDNIIDFVNTRGRDIKLFRERIEKFIKIMDQNFKLDPIKSIKDDYGEDKAIKQIEGNVFYPFMSLCDYIMKEIFIVKLNGLSVDNLNILNQKVITERTGVGTEQEYTLTIPKALMKILSSLFIKPT